MTKRMYNNESSRPGVEESWRRLCRIPAPSHDRAGTESWQKRLGTPTSYIGGFTSAQTTLDLHKGMMKTRGKGNNVRHASDCRRKAMAVVEFIRCSYIYGLELGWAQTESVATVKEMKSLQHPPSHNACRTNPEIRHYPYHESGGLTSRARHLLETATLSTHQAC